MGPVVIPAIDILGGRCVRLTKGDYNTSTVYSADPLEMVARFARAGAQRMHVVDLDAARGQGDNAAVIDAVLAQPGIEFQVAGGVRDEEKVDALLSRGARWVVMGTSAVTKPHVLAASVRRHPGRVLAALDVRDGRPAIAGWTETAPTTMDALIALWDALEIGAIVLTCIERDGTMEGPDLATVDRVHKLTRHELIYSGGVTSVEQLTQLAAAGAHRAIVGKAIYEEKISLEEAFAI